MRAVLVDQDSSLVATIVGIAADMRPPVDQEHLFVALARQPLGNDAPAKPAPTTSQSNTVRSVEVSKQILSPNVGQ
jgi:hypothetical protein